jgi:hypothetical protein
MSILEREFINCRELGCEENELSLLHKLECNYMMLKSIAAKCCENEEISYISLLDKVFHDNMDKIRKAIHEKSQ